MKNKKKVIIIIIIIMLVFIGVYRRSQRNFLLQRLEVIYKYEAISSMFRLYIDTETTASEDFSSYFVYCKKSILFQDIKMQDVAKGYGLEYYYNYDRGNTPEQLVDIFNENLSEGGYYSKYAGRLGYETELELEEIFNNPDKVAELINEVYKISVENNWQMEDFVKDHTGEEPLGLKQ